jgi:hypothetical protein
MLCEEFKEENLKSGTVFKQKYLFLGTGNWN